MSCQQADMASLAAQGNNFTYTCNAQQSYINDICLTSSAPSPAQLPPMGTTTAGSRTASGGLPRTNQTLPANNGSLPDQMQYPGTTVSSCLQCFCVLSESLFALWHPPSGIVDCLCGETAVSTAWRSCPVAGLNS